MIKRKKIKINPALQILVGFLAFILVGTFLLCLPISSNDGQWFSFVDSLFTSTSAVCVTGLIVVDTAVHFSLFGQIVILILIQIGGLGFITLTSLLFMLIGKKLTYQNRVALQESLSRENAQGIVKFVRNIVILVFVIEFVGFVCLAPSMIISFGWGDGIFKALFLSVSAFCNAGFDVLGMTSANFQSLSGFAQSSLVLLPIMFLIVIGGIGYMVLFDIGAKIRKKSKLSFHTKVMLVATFVLVFGGAFLFALLEWNNPETIGNMNVWDKIVNSFFQSITLRTAGFATYDLSKLTPASKIVSDILMFIGGGSASTAGGIKVTTMFVLLLAIFKSTNADGEYIFMRKQIKSDVVRKSMRVVFLNMLFVVVSTFLICIFEGGLFSITDVVYETISAISTVGTTMGITPLLGTMSRLVLIVVMFVGRVGAVTLTVAFGARNKRSAEVEYPDSKIIVG